MAPLTQIFAASLLALQASAHFVLTYPPSLGFSDDLESSGPCGSFSYDASRSNVTDFRVGGDTVYVNNYHPTANFLIRATTNTGASSGWVNLRQVQVVGLNGACIPQVTAPQNLTGSRGLIQVVANGVDGVLYQCAAVNFVNGTGPSGGSGGCTNSTGVTISAASDAKLSSFTSNSGSAPASSGASASPSASRGAAASSMEPMSYGPLGAAAWMVIVAAVSCAVTLV